MSGKVTDRHVVIVDDMIDTAGTVCNAAEMVKEFGAKCVRIAATHGIFRSRLSIGSRTAPIEEVIVTNTLPVSDRRPVTRQAQGAVDRIDPGRGPPCDLHGLVGVGDLPRRQRLARLRFRADGTYNPRLVTARHRQPSPSDNARYRALLIGLVAVFLLGFLFLRVLGDDGGGAPGAADDTTTTSTPADGGTGSTDGNGSTPSTTAGDGTGSTTSGSTPTNLPRFRRSPSTWCTRGSSSPW